MGFRFLQLLGEGLIVAKILTTCNAFLVLCIFSVATVSAHENENHYDRVHLTANASAKIQNDTMVAVVYTVEEGSDAAKLSSIVNKRIRNGLQLVKKYPSIKSQTNAYTSNPVYSNNKIKGWRVSQSLRLESKNMALMSDILGRLQSTLALKSMHFTVSDESKNKQDEKLINKALEAFEKRAQQVVNKLHRKHYKIVNINISTTGAPGVRKQYDMRAMSVSSMESAPAVSAGEQTVNVNVSGSIELE